ncbi:MAG TPA: hypothetical protein VKH34_03480 [Vicinamibacterales bacterium]|nr:hypothetical protein [Vicinamibacterales bacterium]
MLVIVAPVPSSRLIALPAAAWTALAAWLSFGTIAFTSGGASASRLGILPLATAHLALAVLAGLVVLVIGLRGGNPRGLAAAVAPLVLVFLPWLPSGVPAVFLVWTGAIVSLVWIAVSIALAVLTMTSWGAEMGGLRAAATAQRWPALPAGLAALVIFSLAAFHASPSLPSGDEPHYLVITQSLLYDGDLEIANNHRRGDYRAYFGGDLPPHAGRPGRRGGMYSIHAPGLPALAVPAFAIGGYHGVVVFLILVSAAACALAWWLAWRVTGSRAAAWFGWAAVALSAPFVLESYTVFPDAPGAAIVLTGFWALLREGLDGSEPDEGRHASSLPYLWHGAALALLPWLHTRFAVLAATLGGLILVRISRAENPFTKAAAFLTVPALGAVAWLGFFLVVYGTLDPSAPYGGDVGSSFAYLANGAGGLLFDQGFGLIATAPILAVALVGFARTRRLGLEWLVVAVPYGLAVGTFAMWWAGTSGPARFLVPLVLPLAIPAACAWTAARSRGIRAVMLAALVVTGWLSAVYAGGGDGRLGYHTRNEGGMTAAPYLEWANPVVDLPSAFPAFVPLPVGTGLQARQAAARSGFAATLPWLFCLGGAVLMITWLGRHTGASTLVPAATLIFAAAITIAISIVWRMHATDPLTLPAAQMHALRRIASGPAAVFDLARLRRIDGAEIQSMQIDAPIRRGARGGPRLLNLPLAAFAFVPAGTYTVSVKRHGAGDGLLIVGVGADQFAIVTQPVAAFDAGVTIRLPAGARALTIRADESARDELDGVALRPVAVDTAPITRDVARRAVHYDGAIAFFLDDRAFAEPAGFWVGGRRETRVVLLSDAPRATASLVLRNAPVDNTVTLDAGGRQEAMVLTAGEERRVEVPLDATGRSAIVRIGSAAGFRPSERDQNSRDSRLLGVYVTVR